MMIRLLMVGVIFLGIGIVAHADEPRFSFRPFVSLRLPLPLEVGMRWSQSPHWSYAVSGGYLPLPLGAGRWYRSAHVETSGRWHPFSVDGSQASGMFLGAGARFQHLSVVLPLSFIGESEAGAGTMGTLSLWGFYLVPHAGYRWQISERIALSWELGLQIAWVAQGGLGVAAQNSTPTVQTLVASIERAFPRVAGYYASMTLPVATLFQLEWRW